MTDAEKIERLRSIIARATTALRELEGLVTPHVVAPGAIDLAQRRTATRIGESEASMTDSEYRALLESIIRDAQRRLRDLDGSGLRTLRPAETNTVPTLVRPSPHRKR